MDGNLHVSLTGDSKLTHMCEWEREGLSVFMSSCDAVMTRPGVSPIPPPQWLLEEKHQLPASLNRSKVLKVNGWIIHSGFVCLFVFSEKKEEQTIYSEVKPSKPETAEQSKFYILY